MLTLTTLCVATFLASVIGSVIGCSIGVQGRARQALRVTKELESDLASLEERVSREQKKRAGLATQATRQEHLAEAYRLAAEHQNSRPAVSQLPGRMIRG